MSTEAAIVADRVKAIRDRERYARRKYEFPPQYLTYWDADSLRFDFLRQGIEYRSLLNTKFGKEIRIYGMKPKSPPDGVICVDGADIVEAQFLSEQAISSAMEKAHMVMSVFQGASFGELVAINSGSMLEFCRTVDDRIIEMAKDLNKRAIKNAFRKMWKEMGGGSIPEQDRVARRVGWFADLADAFVANKDTYRAEMRRFGLVK